HFASPQARSLGQPDHRMTLTDALMEAFPEHSRHTFFARASDAVGGVTSGGRASPGVLSLLGNLVHGKDVRECFTNIGRFLWSRTGPGYLYNTFFANGNVIDTVSEDARALDEAFGVFAAGGDFKGDTGLRLSHIVGAFKEKGAFSELPYVKRLYRELDTYWDTVRTDWPVLARYRFVQQARQARMTGALTQAAYELVMRGGAPHVSLDGPITLAQLRDARPSAAPVVMRRFDINGYFASNLVRFLDRDGSEVLYLPGADSPFVAFASEGDLRRWVLVQAKDPGKLEALLARFSIYDGQDGTFWTGVKHALDNVASGKWKADAGAIDHADAVITGDIFADMRAQTERRWRDDARMKVGTAWEAWRTAINRTVVLLGPLGYVPALAIPVQAGTGLISLGTGIDQGVRGRTEQARRAGVEQAVMTIVGNVPLGAGFGGLRKPEATGAGTKPAFVAPRRVNGRIGYLMGPTRPLRILPTLHENATYPRLDPVAEAGPPATARAWEKELTDAGYTVLAVPANHAGRVQAIISLKKEEIVARQAEFAEVSDSEPTRNALGYLTSTDHPFLYRVDSRSPQHLLAQGGFGPSRNFIDVYPLLPGEATIASDSMDASTAILNSWASDPANSHFGAFYQYVVRTAGREVASVSDNEIPGADPAMSEVHFPSDIRPDDIYVLDSTDADHAKAISEIIESEHVSTPYGVPLEALTEYMAGRLDIQAPNRFSEHYLDADLVSVPGREPGAASNEGTASSARRPSSTR
ncbi:MAG: dermonecrotic toxin domain-containing protein, partial [Luteibacter jiangsuensis]